MTILELIDRGLEYGLQVAFALWWVLSLLCLAGLAYMLGGHRLAILGHKAINQAALCGMTAILVLSVIYVALALYGYSHFRSYGYAVVMFLGRMLPSIVLSAIGVVLWRYSRFPRSR